MSDLPREHRQRRDSHHGDGPPHDHQPGRQSHHDDGKGSVHAHGPHLGMARHRVRGPRLDIESALEAEKAAKAARAAHSTGQDEEAPKHWAHSWLGNSPEHRPLSDVSPRKHAAQWTKKLHEQAQEAVKKNGTLWFIMLDGTNCEKVPAHHLLGGLAADEPPVNAKLTNPAIMYEAFRKVGPLGQMHSPSLSDTPISQLKLQKAIYYPGIGSASHQKLNSDDKEPSWTDYFTDATDKAADIMSASSFIDLAADLYASIVEHVDPEKDEIVFAAFSRGAYMARFLTAILDWKGIAGMSREHAHETVLKLKKHVGLKQPFALPHVPAFTVKALVLFDTVGSIPTVPHKPWSSETHVAGTLFCGLNLWSLRNYQLALHAVALDETFIGFAPTVMLKPPAGATLKQVYFAGRHSDLGGVTSLSRVSLAWAVSELEKHKVVIAFDPGFLLDYIVNPAPPRGESWGFQSLGPTIPVPSWAARQYNRLDALKSGLHARDEGGRRTNFIHETADHSWVYRHHDKHKKPTHMDVLAQYRHFEGIAKWDSASFEALAAEHYEHVRAKQAAHHPQARSGFVGDLPADAHHQVYH